MKLGKIKLRLVAILLTVSAIVPQASATKDAPKSRKDLLSAHTKPVRRPDEVTKKKRNKIFKTCKPYKIIEIRRSNGILQRVHPDGTVEIRMSPRDPVNVYKYKTGTPDIRISRDLINGAGQSVKIIDSDETVEILCQRAAARKIILYSTGNFAVQNQYRNPAYPLYGLYEEIHELIGCIIQKSVIHKEDGSVEIYRLNGSHDVYNPNGTLRIDRMSSYSSPVITTSETDSGAYRTVMENGDIFVHYEDGTFELKSRDDIVICKGRQNPNGIIEKYYQDKTAEICDESGTILAKGKLICAIMDKPIEQVDLREAYLQLESIKPYSFINCYLSKIRGLGFYAMDISYPNGFTEVRHGSDGEIATYDPWGNYT